MNRLTAIGQENINIENFYTKIMLRWPTVNITSIYGCMFIPKTGYNKLRLYYGNIYDYVPWNERYGPGNLRK